MTPTKHILILILISSALITTEASFIQRKLKPDFKLPNRILEEKTTLKISAKQFATMFPKSSMRTLMIFHPFLQAAMDNANINTVSRVAAFIAQVARETLEFRYFQDNDDFGADCEGLCTELGNCEEGDGTRYMSRGALKITGRKEYKACGDSIGIDLENSPQKAQNLQYSFKVGAWVWTTDNLNTLADQAGEEDCRDIFDQISAKIDPESDSGDRDVRHSYYKYIKRVLKNNTPTTSESSTQPAPQTQPQPQPQPQVQPQNQTQAQPQSQPNAQANNTSDNNTGDSSNYPVTIDQLAKIFTQNTKEKLLTHLPYLNKALVEGEVTTCPRLVSYLAEIAQETTELNYLVELGDGSRYEGDCAGLGNCNPGDGPRYKGRGAIQLTGRYNYRSCGTALGVDFENQPELVAQSQYAFRCATWFWSSHNLNSLADQNTKEAFDQTTLKINGCVGCSWTHQDGRIRYWNAAKEVLGC